MHRPWFGRVLLASAALLAVVACETAAPTNPTALSVPSALVVIPSTPPPVTPGQVWVCLDAPAGSYGFSVSQQAEIGGTVGTLTAGADPTIQGGQCIQVWAKTVPVPGGDQTDIATVVTVGQNSPIVGAVFGGITWQTPRLTQVNGQTIRFEVNVYHGAVIRYSDLDPPPCPAGTHPDPVDGNFCHPDEPALNITKTADAASVTAGGQIGFTITVSNTGSGTASGVTLSDALPAGPGISWGVAANSTPVCSITNGSLGCSFGDLAPGASAIAHVVSPTTNGSCGVYTNTARVSAGNHEPVVSSPATVQVGGCVVDMCPSRIGGIDLGGLNKDLFLFTDGSTDANWQSASKGFVGNVVVNGLLARERTSGTFAYAGTISTNDATLGAWQQIVNNNAGQATASTGQGALVTSRTNSLNAAFAQINALPVTAGYASRSAASLDGLNTQNGVAETIVINVTSGFQVSAKLEITGDAGDVFILRWDSDANSANGYQGQVKFQSGGAIVPLGGLTAGSFVHVAGDLTASGGGSNPPAPYPQGPRLNGGQGALISGGQNWNGGGFFTGYWLTTGNDKGETASMSNAIFVGGWYSTTSKFSMTSGTSGVQVCPPAAAAR